MKELPNKYDPKIHEAKIYKQWEESGVFKPNKAQPSSQAKPYVIMLPPPNITGSLHMGHALQDTIIDILARYHRLLREEVLWLPGTDHAALPTNKIMIDQLQAEGTTAESIGREEFQRRTDKWYAKTGAEILNQMKRLGCSCDWNRHRFTMDNAYLEAVQEAFIRYFKRGYIYRGARIVNWDPLAQTTVSDLEIDWRTEKAPLYTLQYGPFEISTARPETKFGDKYVVMNPLDDRYKQYKHGDQFVAEWINGKVTATVIKDSSVDPDFGTGVMTITPWHDAADFATAQRHDLAMEQIIDFKGNLLPVAGEFAGQTITAARPKIVTKLKDKKLLVSVDEKYEHNVALNDRGKGVIEPQVMRQWFMDMNKIKKETIEVINNDLIEFVPSRWKEHMLTWLENVYDWNINRQIWLGHRLPVWWRQGTHGSDKEEGNYIVSINKPVETDQGGSGDIWEQDPDVLDTWFSSALWPFATLGWPKSTDDLKDFYPTSVLITAREILYLWVARMLFSGLDLMTGKEYGSRSQADRLPFRQVFIHPVVLAKDGRRMSKSLGTGVDPLKLIDQYGADATRFGLMSQMSYDMQQMKFDEEAIKSGRNFANKLWNIARLINALPESTDKTEADEWIEGRFSVVAAQVKQLLETYKFGEAARVLHDFVRNDFADWYLEILKVGGSKSTAKDVLMRTLIVLHPFMPHITEVIWQHYGNQDQLISEVWPSDLPGEKKLVDEMMIRFQDIVSTIRSARSLLSIPVKATVDIYIKNPPLPMALTKLARANPVAKAPDTMKIFPLKSGERLYLGSEHITAESTKKAQQSLNNEADKLTLYIKKQEKIINKMRGRADEKVVNHKLAELTSASARLSELQESARLLAD